MVHFSQPSLHLISTVLGKQSFLLLIRADMPSIGSLDLLISELDKITQQQVTLRTAVHLNQAIVVHPRKEASRQKSQSCPCNTACIKRHKKVSL